MPPVTPSMIYQAYRTQADYLDLVRPLAAAAGSALRLPWPRLGQDWPLRRLAGVLETFANLTVIHARLPFGIESVPDGNCLVPVTEEAVYSTPFATQRLAPSVATRGVFRGRLQRKTPLIFATFGPILKCLAGCGKHRRLAVKVSQRRIATSQ